MLDRIMLGTMLLSGLLLAVAVIAGFLLHIRELLAVIVVFIVLAPITWLIGRTVERWF